MFGLYQYGYIYITTGSLNFCSDSRLMVMEYLPWKRLKIGPQVKKKPGRDLVGLLGEVGGVQGPPLQVLVVKVGAEDVRAHVVADTVDIPARPGPPRPFIMAKKGPVDRYGTVYGTVPTGTYPSRIPSIFIEIRIGTDCQFDASSITTERIFNMIFFIKIICITLK